MTLASLIAALAWLIVQAQPLRRGLALWEAVIRWEGRIEGGAWTACFLVALYLLTARRS